MRITESRGSRETTLFLAGKINDVTSPQLQNEIFRASKITKDLTLDFSDVESINKSGVQVLQSAIRLVESRRGKFKVQNCDSKVRQELQKEGLGRLLTY